MTDRRREVVEKAYETVYALAKSGGRSHRMTIPPDPSVDTDLILIAALDIAEASLAQPDRSMDAKSLAVAIRRVEQNRTDTIGVVGPAVAGPPPEWYDQYAADILAALMNRPMTDDLEATR